MTNRPTSPSSEATPTTGELSTEAQPEVPEQASAFGVRKIQEHTVRDFLSDNYVLQASHDSVTLARKLTGAAFTVRPEHVPEIIALLQAAANE